MIFGQTHFNFVELDGKPNTPDYFRFRGRRIQLPRVVLYILTEFFLGKLAYFAVNYLRYNPITPASGFCVY